MSQPAMAAPLTFGRARRHGRVAFGIAIRAAPVHVLGLAALATLTGLAPVVAAWLLKLVVDGLIVGSAEAALVGLAVALATLGVATAVLPRVNGYVEAALNRAVKVVAFEKVFATVNDRLRGLARLEDPRFHDRLRLAQSAGASAPGQVASNTVGFGRGALTLFGFLTTLLLISPWLALVIAVAALPTIRAEVLLSRRRVGAMWRIEHAERRRFFYSDLLTAPQEAKEVRLFGLGGFFRGRMLDELRTANHTERALDRRELAVQSALGLLGAAVAGAGLIWAITAARAGALTPGDITVFVAAVGGVQGGLSDLISRYGQLHQSLLMLNHYQHVVGVERDLPVRVDPRPVPPLRDAIVLHDVWFRYAPGRPWALRGVNLTIPAHRATALVGVNGAGKSTIVKLLCRLYDPTDGRITWDGVDLRDVDPDQLRERIAAVFQDYVEYELSAAENIGLGDLPRLDDRDGIQEAAERAGVHEALTALPRGYDTLLTRMYMDNADRDDPETGVLLSGGQGQRLALARMFHRRTRDLAILDEPSAGLDAEAESEIHHQLRGRHAVRTSVLISHRLNTIRDADRIAVLEEGEITEYGDHATLMARAGTYARLFNLQARGYADPSTGPAGAAAGSSVEKG